jgi:peptide/nickel transport system substrate-binding protein
LSKRDIVTRRLVWQALLALLGIALIFIVLFQLVSSVPEEEVAVESTPEVEVPVAGGTYVEGVMGYWETMNPILAPPMIGGHPAEQDLNALIFDGLTVLAEDGQPAPALATDWQVSEDGLEYLFRLRQDVTWHDSAPFTAADVAFTVQAMQDPDYQGDASLSDLWRAVVVEQLDTYTVRFRLAEPFPSFLYYTTVGLLPVHLLGNVPAAVLPSHSFSREHPVGTGMFRVESALPDRVVLVANENYWGELPYLNSLEFWFYDDWQGLLTDFERGEVHAFHPLDNSPISDLARMPHLQLYSAQAPGYGIAFLNLKRESLPFLQVKEVRQSLLYGLDRQELIEDVLGGQGLLADSPVLPILWAYDPAVRHYAHDPERAIGLLDAAGWVDTNGDRIRDRDGVDLAFTLLTSDEPAMVSMAEGMAAQWLALGIRARVRAVSSEEANNLVRDRNFDVALVRLALTADPDPYPLWHSSQAESGQNYAGFASEEADLVMEEARVTADVERLTELYHSFQQIFTEDVPALILYYPVYTYAVNDSVRHVQLSPLLTISQRFRNVEDWYVPGSEAAVNGSDPLDKSKD